MNKQSSAVRLHPVINEKIQDLIDVRDKKGVTESKQSLVASLIIQAHKKECKQ